MSVSTKTDRHTADAGDAGDAGALDMRAQAARSWAACQLGLCPDAGLVGFAPASADASFRRYFRITDRSGMDGTRSWIVMDAPPEHEDCRPFIRVAALMHEAGLCVPQVRGQNIDAGYLLLSDLGRQTCLDVVDGVNADGLYRGAIDSLILWQRASRPDVLPDYDAALLNRELALFPEWYLARHLGVTLGGAERRTYNAVSNRLVAAAQAQPRVYVHRDFMLRNLMPRRTDADSALALASGAEWALPGVLDFQDAVYGPLAYDPICLFKDAFLSWPEERVDGWLEVYHERATAAGIAVPEWPRFRRDCDWIGLQRHLKVLGIFARLTHRDGKPKYAADTPRFVRYVMDVATRYPELAPLVALFERHVLPRVFLS